MAILRLAANITAATPSVYTHRRVTPDDISDMASVCWSCVLLVYCYCRVIYLSVWRLMEIYLEMYLLFSELVRFSQHFIVLIFNLLRTCLV